MEENSLPIYANVLKKQESMKLKDYLDSRNLGYKEFSDMIGISQSALSNYIHFRREPRKAIRNKIIKVTKGKVSLQDLLPS